ncbi:Hypothetical protein SMB2099_3910 [Serratia marcescens SMB2099]|nr:Hypothetical protein SMB2099_3910 [Serratia marcescens SMB2099]
MLRPSEDAGQISQTAGEYLVFKFQYAKFNFKNNMTFVALNQR